LIKATVTMPSKTIPSGEPAFVELLLQEEDQIEEFDLPADSQIKFEDCYVPAMQIGGNVIAVRKPDNELLDALKEFGNHDEFCMKLCDEHGDCTCGWNKKYGELRRKGYL